MTNWNDPILLIAEARSSSSLLDKGYDSSLSDSRLHQARSCHRWRVLVSHIFRSWCVDPNSHITPVGNLS
jgi:hypothetical protein